MPDRSILFSASMIRALIEGRKTQTRRVVKGEIGPCAYAPGRNALNGQVIEGNPGVLGQCPYGQPGDRLWVQEAHAFTWRNGHEVFVRYTADGFTGHVRLTDEEAAKLDARTSPLTRQQPGRFLYRSCSRLALEVTDVRVQRLQEISEEDARAEGIERSNDERWPWRNYDPLDGAPFVRPTTSFMSLWESINGERPGCSWEANPWVWCVSFKVLR